MKKYELTDKSTEKLKFELKGIKVITGALTGILIILLVVNLYGLLAKDNNAAFIGGIVVAISLSAILPLQFVTMKKIKTELNNRKENNELQNNIS